MRNGMKSLAASALILTMATAGSAVTIYQNAFDAGPASLNGLTAFGTGSIAVSGGQLTIGLSGSSHAGVGLNPSAVSPVYSSVLGSNPGIITWAVNLANQDGPPNNGFDVVLACNTLDPFGISSVGYALRGGSMVENRMMLYRFDFGLGGGGNIVIDIPSTNGLGTLPQLGSFKITFDPSTDTWAVFGEVGNSYVDPLSVTTLLGTGVDSGHTGIALPYFSLAGLNGGTDYFDNLSITLVPEPSCLALAVVGGILLVRFKRKLAAVAVLALALIVPGSANAADLIAFDSQSIDHLVLAGPQIEGAFQYQATVGLGWEVQTEYGNPASALATFFNNEGANSGDTVQITAIGGGLFFFNSVDFATRLSSNSDDVLLSGFLGGSLIGSLALTNSTLSPLSFETVPSGFGGNIDLLVVQVSQASHNNALFLDNFNFTVVPEPSALTLAATGGILISSFRKRGAKVG